jgi:ribosome-binding ATPase YchF (GTP1/OBG family)
LPHPPPLPHPPTHPTPQRFNWLVKKYAPKSVVPGVLGVTDIAGLIAGASEGAGLGNAFLSHIGATDGIYHMLVRPPAPARAAPRSD